MTPVAPSLAEALAVVAPALAEAEAAVGRYADDPRGFHRRHRDAMEALSARLSSQLGARIANRWDGARVRIAGVAASSTSGLAGALHNWVKAAKKRVGQS